MCKEISRCESRQDYQGRNNNIVVVPTILVTTIRVRYSNSEVDKWLEISTLQHLEFWKREEEKKKDDELTDWLLLCLMTIDDCATTKWWPCGVWRVIEWWMNDGRIIICWWVFAIITNVDDSDLLMNTRSSTVQYQPAASAVTKM